MIIRIVKMTFAPSNTERFLELFESWKPRIRSFPGCRHLELLRDTAAPNVFFTYSHWDSPDDLERYRSSDVFSEVWPAVKPLFSAPTEAWTVDRVEHLP
ncbi:MAG: antibiotic biosynthesis monooxygenase [Flavobacteriales bacterium]|nr:antibiotic biosynthesis monooxygenase [Flavobacteriales bacterium]